MKVWDPVVRLTHWLVATCVGVAWVSSLDGVGFGPHENAGLFAGALVLVRLVWGFCGSHHARLKQFLRGPAATWHHATEVWRRADPRHIGHNPLGGWMAIALWLCVLSLAASGWLYTTDAFWGEAWLNQLHLVLAWLLLALVGLHLCGVLWTSLRHRENLVRAMVTGNKPAPGPHDVA